MYLTSLEREEASLRDGLFPPFLRHHFLVRLFTEISVLLSQHERFCGKEQTGCSAILFSCDVGMWLDRACSSSGEDSLC